MKFKTKHAIIVLISIFALDLVYLVGQINNIESITRLSIWWFSLAAAGFIISYFMNAIDIRDKVAINIFITIGLVINLTLIFIWYIFKDFGF